MLSFIEMMKSDLSVLSSAVISLNPMNPLWVRIIGMMLQKMITQLVVGELRDVLLV